MWPFDPFNKQALATKEAASRAVDYDSTNQTNPFTRLGTLTPEDVRLNHWCDPFSEPAIEPWVNEVRPKLDQN